jgi:hypothetical protein
MSIPFYEMSHKLFFPYDTCPGIGPNPGEAYSRGLQSVKTVSLKNCIPVIPNALHGKPLSMGFTGIRPLGLYLNKGLI